MKTLSAYNPGSERVLSSRLLVIDAAREPIKVLKILTQGLAAHTRYGIWLVNCQGVPVARAASDFDLLYLDEEQRVLHGIELSPSGEFEPFRGHSASILILQSKTIARSRTFTGDRIRIDPAGTWSIDAEPPTSSGLTAHLPSQMVTEFSTKSVGIPSHSAQDTQATVVSTRPMRSGRLARNRPAIVRPPAPPAPAQSTELSPNASTPISARATADLSFGAPRTIAPIPHDHTLRTPDATPAAAGPHFEPNRTIAPTPRERTPSIPAPIIAEVPARLEQPLVTHSFPASTVTSLEQPSTTRQTPAKTQAPNGARREGPAHESSRSAPDLEAGDELERLRKKILAWLYPNPRGRRRRRRAPRIDAPGLVGYYFAGGPSTPHEIKNISVRGFYMVMNQRWMPGTILRVTLQTLESGGEDSLDSITVLSRVVRWGPDGGGFEFVFPGLKD